MASKGADEAPADASAEESFKRYVEPVRVYNHIKNRARKNPLFLKRTVRYTKLHAIRNGADDADKQSRLELRVRCRYPKRAEHSDGPGGGRASNVDVVYAVLCVEKRPWTEWLGLIPKSNPKPEEKEESAAPIAVDASSDAAASPATEGSDAKKSPSSNANGDSVDKSTHASPDGSSPAKFTGSDLSKASQPTGRVDPSFDDEALNPDDRMFDDEDLDAPYVNVTALQCRRIKVVPGGEFDEKNYYDAVFDHPELSRYVDSEPGEKPAEGQLRVAFVTWDGLAGLGDALCGSSHPTRNKCTLYARPKEGDEGIREHGIALGVIPQNARVRVSFCSAVPDGSCVRNPTGQSDVMRSHVIQPYPPVSDSPWTIHRNVFTTTAFGDGSYESVELVFDGMSETDVVAASKGASMDPRDMSDAEAQAVPFVEFELSRHVPPTRNVEPETKLPGEQRAKGRVVFHYLYHGRQMRKTELTTGFTCPFCLCVNADFDGMSRHLEACHDAFNFEFLPKVQNEADPRVHVVCRSEEEVRSKNGSGEVRKESARRKEASEWFFKHGGWFVQSKAKVQMTHHEVGGDGGVVRKDVSPTCADREFVYASTRYRMPRWLQHQRSQHHASVSAPGPRGPYRRRIDKEVEKVAQLKQRAEAAEIQHQLKIQRHQLEQLQRHRHQQFAGRHRLVGDINHILTPQVHPGLLNHLMLNQGPGGQLGMQQGLQLGGQLGGLGGGAFAGGISGLNTNAAYGLGLAGMTPTHQLQQQQLQQQQMQQQQQLQQLLLRQQGHQQHQPFPPRKDVIRAWVEHRLQDVDPVALARELGITPREIEAGDSMIRELRGHMSILTEAHAAAGKVLHVPKPKPKPTRPPIGPAYMAGVPPPDDDVRVRGDPSSPTNFVNLTTGAAADDDDVFEHDERVRHRRKTRDLNKVTRAAPRRYKKMEKWSTRDVGRPKKPKTTEVSGVKAPGLDFLMEAVTEDRGAEGADTAVRDGDSSPKHSTSAGAFIARSRSLARQSSTVSSNNATSTSVTSPLRASLGSPTGPHASRTSEAGTGGTSGVDGASGDPFDEDEPVRDPRRSRSSGGGMMNLNVPVLVAGLRVTLRPVSSGATKPNKVEGDTGKETGGGEDDGDNTKKKGAGHLAWSTWQLLKNAATFIKVTVTDVSIDARNMDNASLRGVHTARRAVLAATTAFKGRGLTLTALTERIAVGAEDVSDVTHSCSRTAVRGYLLDGRVDISARYSARERRAVCVGVELDVGDLDVETNAGGGGGVSQTFTSSLARDSDEEGAGATFSSNFATVASRLESLPATVSCRLGRVRVRRSARADSIGDGSIDRPLVGVAADLSVRCVRQTKEERVARHRRKNRSLFPDKETIAKLTARSTVEARWRSLDIHTTEHENGIDDTFGDITQSEKEPEARSRCGESVFTARFPLVKSNGPKTVVPKATVRAEVRRADGCNHPALVRAVASAVRSTGGFQKKPSRKVGLDGKKERASKPCEWTCDARLHFVDGVRLRAHDGDRGVVGEWHARRWELSEDDLALFGESRRVGIEGGEESGSPGSKLSLSPSISSSVEGLRVALSPVDTVADPRARHTRALRPVLSAERFGWSKGPVSPPPPSPGSWAERDDDSKGGDGNTGSSRSATAGSYARDVELMGATIELTCGDAVALDRSWRRTMESLARSFSEVKRVQSGGGGGVKNDDEDDDGGGSSESNGPKTPVSTAVTLIDVCARIHADMPTRGHPDVDVTYAPSIPTNSKCALELTVPLSTVSSTDGGTRGGSGWRLETSGWYVTYHDGVCTDADPSADINGVHPAQFADGSETAPGGFNSSSKGRPEMRAENGTVRVLTVEHGAIDHSLDTDTTTMSGDGVWGFWQPDAHFMAQEAAAAMNAVSSARKDSEAFNAAGLSEAKDKKSLERRGGVGLDLSRVTFAFDVTAGGAVTLSAHGLTSTDIAAAIRASKPSIAVNGYPVCSSESAEVTFGGGNENDGGKVLPALGETSTSVCDSSNRKRVRLTFGPDTRLVLPWGLDLGDAEAALDAGYAAFISVGGMPFANSSSSSKSTRASQREVPLEFTLEACGTLRADAFDSPLARCVRGKSAVLGPALASARAAEAAKTQGSKSSEKQSAYEARVAAYVEACVAAAAEGAVSYPNGSSADVLDSPETPKNPRAVYHESAARVTIEGGFKSTFVVGGYRSSNNDLDAARSLDELNAVQASPSERAAKRADAPWSDNVRLRVSQAARIRIDARDVSVDLPLSPAPVFRCGRFLAEGFVATARQATVGIPGCPPPLPLPVGRRRFGSSRHPASPPRPPVKLYTDVDVTLEHPGGCFAVASEPALMSLSQQLVRMSPPSSGHANAPGGRGGRLRRDAERAAASWDAAHRGWPKGPDGCYGAAAPSLPPWDFWRASWRGRARVTGSELAYVIDARCAPTIAEVRAGPVGLEFGASRIEVDVSPGSINIRAARLTLGARGGVGTPGHDPDDEQPSAANNFGDVDVSLEEKAGMSVCLAVVPAVELTLGFDWATLGNVGGGGQDHHGFDSLTGIERVPYAGQFSVGCHLTAHATLTTKERALPRWRAETDDSTWQGGVDEGAETSKNAAKPPDDSAPTPFVKRDTNRRASLGTPGSMGTPGSLTKWTSGDFFARISGGGGDISSPNGDVASPNGPPTPSSPSSPAFASRVSAAAAASVADEANTPTIIVGPRALRWLRRFVKDLSSPSGCARRAWRLPTPGGPKRVRHPLSKSINYVIDEVSFSASCDNLRVAHPAESESDPARGLTAQVTGLRVTSRLKPAPPSAQSPYEKTNRVGVGVDGLRRRSTIEPSCVLDTLEVELEEVRVLLPPADNGSEVFSPTGAKKGSNNGGSNNGSNVDSPSGGVSGLRGFGTGDFDQEAEGYKAVIEMLEGRSVGASFQGPGSPGDGSGLTSGVASGVSESRFARESQFARRRRETATDPALVLETRSVKLVRRVDSPPAFTMELTPVNSKTTPPGGVNGECNPWLHVTVEAPRLLKAASTRDALVQWIRDAYRAALKPNPPKRSLTSLNALASRPDETVDPETGFKLTDGFGDETSQTGSTLNEGSSRATNAERLGLPNHIRGKSASSSGSHGQRAKSSSTSSHMGVGLFDDDFDLIDDSVFGDGQTDAKDETAVTKNATNPTTTPAGTKRREKHQSWDGSPVSTAAAAKGDHPNEADLLSLLLHEPKDQAAGTRMGKQSPEPESAGSAAHRRSRSELPASLTLPGDVQEARALTAASVATIPEGRPALKPVAVADAGEEREEEEIMFVVDVTTPQINFEGKDGAGRFLLAAVSGRVLGRRARRQFTTHTLSPRSDDDSIFANRGIISPTSPTDADDSDAHWGRRVVAVRLLDAQAHVAPLDVDVYAGVQWLDESLFAPEVGTKATGKQSQTSGKSTGKKQEAAHSYLLRQVFKPCRMDLDFTTHIPEKKKIARVGGDLTPSNNTNNGDNQQPTTRVQDSGNNDGGKTASKSKRKRPEALTEFALRSPEIEAEMSSDQFAALVDVIGSIFLAQIPDHPPRPAMKATALLAVEGRSLVEGEERASAAVVAGPLAAFRVARWAATCAVVDASLAEVFAETQEKCVDPGLGSRSKSGGSKSVPFDGEACARVSRRLARRVEDAERAVDEAVASAEALVRPTRRRPAIKLSLSVDRFRWALRVSGRTFLVARIERLALSRERHVDSSGVTNLRCHELNLDVPPPKVQGARSAQAWADQKGSWKPVLARWDPNAPAAPNTKSANTNSKPQLENANNRPLVRVSALRAASPPEAPIWDRIEVDVQPFDLRIERDMYDRLIAYIFPEKNGDAGAVGGPSGKFLEGHDAYARSLTDTREEWRRKHGTSSASAGIERGTPSKAPRGFSATTIDPKPESEARKILLGTMSPQRFPPKSATNAQSHKRSATWGADLFQAKGGNGGGGYQELADSDVTDEGQQGHKGGQKDGDDMSSLNRRRSRPPSLALPSDTDPDLGLNTGATNQPPAPEEHKKVAVRHLKVNEVLLRVSYDGKPRSFHEVRLLLDEVVTANFEGRWRELIGQLKGNVVWSVLKSITGLQGRRLPGGSTQVTAAADKPTHVVVDSPTKKSGTRTDKGTRAPYKHISESEDEDAFGDDDDDDGVNAGRDGGDGVNAGAYGSQSAGPKRKTKSLFKRVFGVSSAFKTAASSDKTDKTSADEREKLARLMGGKR